MLRFGFTVNEGVFSVWNGQRPFQFSPVRLSFTNCPTISTMSIRARISSRCCWEKPPASPCASALRESRHGGAGAAFRRRAGPVLDHEGMTAQRVLDCAAEGPGALAVNDADRGEPGHEGVVQILLQQVPGLRGGASDEVQLHRYAALARNCHGAPGPRG